MFVTNCPPSVCQACFQEMTLSMPFLFCSRWVVLSNRKTCSEMFRIKVAEGDNEFRIVHNCQVGFLQELALGPPATTPHVLWRLSTCLWIWILTSFCSCSSFQQWTAAYRASVSATCSGVNLPLGVSAPASPSTGSATRTVIVTPAMMNSTVVSGFSYSKGGEL